VRKPYITYRRGKSWYVAFWDYDRREYSSRQSGSELVISLGDRARHLLRTAKSRAAAEEAAQIALDVGGTGTTDETIGTYLEQFWRDDGAYATAYRARAGRALSAEYLAGCRSAITKHVLPWLRQHRLADLPLARVTTSHLEALVMHLYKHAGISPQRVNGIRHALSTPFAEARRLKKISANPVRDTTHLHEPKHEREIFTRAEASKVLARITDSRIRLINVLAATTGMRLGECLGLQLDDLGPRGELFVRHNWQPCEGDKAPKAGSTRIVPAPARVVTALRRLGAQNPWGTPWVFWGSQPRRPLSERIIQAAFVEAVHTAGIPEEERRRRGLTFHAWRHWYRSQLDSAGLSTRAGDALTGHRTEAVGARYTHPTEEQREAVKQIAAKLAEALK